MPNMLRVMGHDNLFRDPSTGIILSKSDSDQRNRLKKMRRDHDIENRLNNLEQKMDLILNLLNNLKEKQ